ncbi:MULTISPECIES: LysR substrate-binding domain-containing protein [Pseudomonas fluorescens group]|uniref:LysR-family regulatory protein n=3 Tax=Pseudomonas fluorescens group TaxID=136843 RepID=C3K935_PSEFS|nr:MULTISPECIES: LysR substrate-binding domain-containing protein [Pseudomonas fluorescens group]KAA6175327.1 transcriptional regulator LrhA [Pseudomonas veronii]KAA6182631.1 transcriptional regulator LrhA [Pseudomonas veronii]MBZ6455829.1 LysR family transcriptional regulator [Pseudomonas fluorescens group sp.]MBZ6465700.1 LysR family transcriptional regulator [Pseudomonas fluorescens group sp.]MBZ6468633.1 LysR family transcriptional regulator [Pseudomonas fluorescens group sp.]
MSTLPTLDLELLRTFIAVVDHHSFAEAGTHLNRTQSSVTQHMQRLEQQVGVNLFEKHGRQKRLTEAGLQLLRHARHMLSMNDEALSSLRENSLSGVLRIGSPHDIADTILPPILSHIARSAPRLRLEIDVGRSPFLMEDLHRGKVDMVISTREDPNLEGFALRTSPVWWICSAQYLHNPSEPLPLILVDEPSIYRRYALEALERANIPWRQAYLASNLIGIKAATRAGLGVTARSMEMLGPDMRVLGETDGLPRLPDVTYHLWIRPNTVNPLVRRAYQLIRSSQGL